MERVGPQLDVQVAGSSIDDANKTAQALHARSVEDRIGIWQSDRPKHHWGFMAERTVARWLLNNGYVDVTRASGAFPDFVARRENREVAVEVKLVSRKPLWLEKFYSTLGSWKPESQYKKLIVFFVALELDHALVAHSDLRRALPVQLGRDVEVKVGYITASGDFAPLG